MGPRMMPAARPARSDEYMRGRARGRRGQPMISPEYARGYRDGQAEAAPALDQLRELIAALAALMLAQHCQ